VRVLDDPTHFPNPLTSGPMADLSAACGVTCTVEGIPQAYDEVHKAHGATFRVTMSPADQMSSGQHRTLPRPPILVDRRFATVEGAQKVSYFLEESSNIVRYESQPDGSVSGPYQVTTGNIVDSDSQVAVAAWSGKTPDEPGKTVSIQLSSICSLTLELKSLRQFVFFTYSGNKLGYCEIDAANPTESPVKIHPVQI
jgi:hypothetical protein